jgi:hypothetical protein
MLANAGQVDKAIDGPEEVIGRHMLLKTEAIEKLFLHQARAPIIAKISRSIGRTESGLQPASNIDFFQRHRPKAVIGRSSIQRPKYDGLLPLLRIQE